MPMFFKLDFNKIELQVELDIKFYAYVAILIFFENLSGIWHC